MKHLVIHPNSRDALDEAIGPNDRPYCTRFAGDPDGAVDRLDAIRAGQGVFEMLAGLDCPQCRWFVTVYGIQLAFAAERRTS